MNTAAMNPPPPEMQPGQIARVGVGLDVTDQLALGVILGVDVPIFVHGVEPERSLIVRIVNVAPCFAVGVPMEAEAMDWEPMYQ